MLQTELQLAPRDQPVPPIWGGHALTSPLDIVVFSKDRAAQLDALLRSLRAFFGFPHRLHVVYTTSTHEFERGYDRLRRWHRGVRWVADEGMFGSAMKNLMGEIGHGPGRYLMFLVDDMLFTRPFTAANLMQSLDEDDDILAVSLRLGENITWCYPHNQEARPPQFSPWFSEESSQESSKGFSQGYRWAWKEASPGDWNYPMSLDAHIYRTADVAGLLPRLNFRSPNTLESALAGQPLPRPDLVCESSPCVVNIAANRVQADFTNRSGNQSVDSLNAAFLAGRAVDVRPFTGRLFNSCHIEEDLPLIADERDPEPPGWTRIERDGRAYLRIDLREIPTFILNCAEDRQKRLLMQEQMSELGMDYEFVHTLRVTPGWVGVALGHSKVLRLSRARPPFLVLEDDCVFNEDFQPVIEVPAEADCLYLSASVFGVEKPGQMSWGKAGGVFWEHYDKGYLRVFNMLARHALLYLDADFQKTVIESQVEALTNRHLAYMCDIGVAMLQPAHIALLTERSMCRQVNRDSTGGRLAEILPGNEWIDGKAIEPGSQQSGSQQSGSQQSGSQQSGSQQSGSQASGPQPFEQKGARVRKPLGAGLISHTYRFIYFQIGKNASSTLKEELSKPRYACVPFAPGTLDDETLKTYFKFSFLRDPVSRLVSAYQEISLRHEMQDSTVRSKPFMEMNDGPERFGAFLDEVEKDKWDRHVFTQSALLGHVPMNFYGRVESFAADLQTVFNQLGLGRCPDLPRRRSRSSRKSDFGYDRFNIDHRQLSPLQISRIRALYHEDVDLLQAFCPAPPLITGESARGPSSQARALAILETEDPAPIELFTRVNEQHEACFVYVFGNRGFFAEVSTVVRAMIYCWAHGYRLLLDSADSPWAYAQGWADYFQPFCATSAGVAAEKIVAHCDFGRPEDRPTWRSLIEFTPVKMDFGHEHIHGFEEIMAFFTTMIFRPTPDCQATIDRLTASLELPDTYDAFHIRRGDKVGDEDVFYPAETYLNRLGRMRPGQTLFVMSDDWAAVWEVRDCLQRQSGDVRVASLAQAGRTGFDVAKFRRREPFMGPPGETTEERPHREYVRDESRALIAETLIAAKAARFVSTWRSNVGRMVSYLHGDRSHCELIHPAAVRLCLGTLRLRGGIVHELKIPADSPCLEPLRGLLSGGRAARGRGLFQVPLQHGRSALTFSGADVRFISLTPPEPARPHHPLTHVAEGHLGGYLRSRHAQAKQFGAQHGDPATYAPELWQWVIDILGVKSVLDVGCGEGHAAAFFRDRNCTVLGVDGSVQAERDSVIPGLHRRHDYSLGPFVPPGRWDLVWSCEFVEHVEERFTHNFLATFACARKYVLMTFAQPGQSGWHHVNCQPQHYWVEKMNRLGFEFDEDLTRQARRAARAGHFKQRGLVFVRANPERWAACTEGEPASVPGSGTGAERFRPHVPVNSMPIVRHGEHDFFLFLDIFVHPARSKIVAVLPWYGEDWNPAEEGVDFERIFLVYRGRRIRGRYLPHRLDSWEPCALLDFEDPLLEKWLKHGESIRFRIEAGPHVRTFCLDTVPPPACNVLMSLVIRDENRWLRHFLEYYLNCLSADHVLVYDNGTSDRRTLMRLLSPYQAAGKVTCIPWDFRWRNLKEPQKMIAQPPQEAHSLNRFANSRWIGFLDVDEFLRLPDTSLPEFLAAFGTADIDGLSFGLRWFQYDGELDFDEVCDPPLTFLQARRSRLGRERQKLVVAPARVRFLRLHSLEEGGRELPVDDTEIYFHHYCQRADRFKKETTTECWRDDYMLRFADRLTLDAPLTPRPHP